MYSVILVYEQKNQNHLFGSPADRRHVAECYIRRYQ